MLIMVESLGADFMGYFGDDRGMTPFLDGLSADSLSFDRFYATGTRTIRGLEAVTLSLPPTPGRSIVKRAGRERRLGSLGFVLRESGYDVAFVYGGRSYFDNMQSFFSGNGYEVIDRGSVPEEAITFENAWGMSDEDLFRQALAAADRSHSNKAPFFLHVLTTSNHRPYTFPSHPEVAPTGGRGAAVRYSDWCIEQFIAQARMRPWFRDTVFVIVGDHSANSAGKIDLPIDRYHIPFLLYSPANIRPAHVTTLSSQIDPAPTLLAILNIDYESSFLGRDILKTPPARGRALIANYQFVGLVANDSVIVLGPRRTISSHSIRRDENYGSHVVPEVIPDPAEIDRAIAYYQGAAYVFDHRINSHHAHDPGMDPPPRFAGIR